MIPWIREKLNERKTKLLLSVGKKKSTAALSDDATNSSSNSTTTNDNKLDDLDSNTNLERSPTSGSCSAGTATSTTAILVRVTTAAVEVESQPAAATAIATAAATATATTLTALAITTNTKTTTIAGSTTGTSSNDNTSRLKDGQLKTSRPSSATSSNITDGNHPQQSAEGRTNRERIKIRVICPSARVLVFQIDCSKKLSELKTEVVLELSDDINSLPFFAADIRSLIPRFRLAKADYEGVELNEQQTIAQLQIQNNDVLVLLFKRNSLQQVMTQMREARGPGELDIENATNNQPWRHDDLPMVDLNEIFQQSNLQFDVRKVLISLAQMSAVVIGVGPYADRLIAMLKQRLINKRNYQNDTVQCLVDMGFSRERAEYALKIHNNVYSTALEWLIHQNEDPAKAQPFFQLPKSTSISSPSAIMSYNNPIDNAMALMEIVRIYSHREVPPNTETIQNLVEMGFPEDEVLEALKKTCNNKAAACEWLCGNRSGSLVELREGLTDDSPILKAILQMSSVQLALGNPKVFLAFLSILENENSLRVWGGNDTSSIITNILQKYHEEKHVMGINQFYRNR